MKTIRTYSIAWKSWGMIVFLSLAFNARGGEFDTYSYELIKSQDDKVCKHMERVYNRAFADDPLDWSGKVTKFNGIEVPLPGNDNLDIYSKLKIYRMKHSFYPTSTEFDAIKWQLKSYVVIDGEKRSTQPMIVAEFDIDNDGKKETVIKNSFFSGSNFEWLSVFRKDKIDMVKEINSHDLAAISDDKAPRIGFGSIIRPFIYEGLTYLHAYDYCRSDRSLKSGPYDPPRTVWIKKYVSGDKTPSESESAVLNDICTFDMISLAEIEQDKKYNNAKNWRRKNPCH